MEDKIDNKVSAASGIASIDEKTDSRNSLGISRLDEVIVRDHQYFMNTFGDRTPVCFTHGEGIYLYGTDGRQYADLIGGIAVNVLGHANKALAGAIAEQASALIHCSNLYYIEKQSLLAEKLVNLAPGMAKVFFANSGAEANEGAIKLARAFFYKKGSPRAKIITAINSFHGRTLATVTATGQEKYSKPFAPLPEGFEHVPFNDIGALERSADGSTCAVMLELIQGESGIIPASMEYIGAAAALCKKHGALLIIDEVQTGMGRCGTFFAYEQFGITPDIVTIAKGLGGGFPIGALLASDEAASAFAPGDHGSTFGGNPLACAAALAVLQEYDSKGLTAKAAASGDYFKSALSAVAASTGKITEIRGMGLMIGIVLQDPEAAAVKNRLFSAGYLVNSVGSSVVRLLPPLIIENNQIDAFCKTLLEVLL